ncbi:unnamed protein product [Diamesa serratosioi]
MVPEDYKVFHESFMKNNNGTTAFDSFLYIIPTSFTIFHTITISALLKQQKNNIPARFMIEFLVICLTLVMYTTILSGYIQHIVFSLFLITLTTVIKQFQGKLYLQNFIQIPSAKPDYISITRSVINLITALCILAVDFQCFPRKLAKTEKFGFGLMDIGVGLFVFSNAITVRPSESSLTSKKIQKLFINCIPLFILGSARLFLTKEINYQEHLTEYGVHWNFFITLAVTKIIGSLIEGLLMNVDYIKFASIIILVLHETSLQLGLSDYIMSDSLPRDNLIAANREGIFSIPGYVALYLGSIYVGSILKSEKQLSKVKDLFPRTFKVSLIALCCWKMIYVCNDMFGVSRRTANMGYIFWTLAIGSTMVVLFMLVEVFVYFVNFSCPQWTSVEVNNKSQLDEPDFHIPYVPIILQAINYNGLAFFLVANLLTGIINIAFQTMLLDTFASLTIITYYVFLLNVIMVFLYVNKFKLKIW